MGKLSRRDWLKVSGAAAAGFAGGFAVDEWLHSQDKVPNKNPAGFGHGMADRREESTTPTAEPVKEFFDKEPDYVLDFGKIEPENLHMHVRIQNGQDNENWTARLNNEEQLYTSDPRNVRIENGRLVIQGHIEDKVDHGQTFHYTSGRVDTQGSFAAEYGKFVTKAKLPQGAGLWCAHWFLPVGGFSDLITYMRGEEKHPENIWKARGEIDVFEVLPAYNMDYYFGSFPPGTGAVASSVHTYKSLMNGLAYSNEIPIVDLFEGFHNFWMEWTPTGIVLGVDDTPVYNHVLDPNADWRDNPFGLLKGAPRKFYPIWNMAFGGAWNKKILEKQGDGKKFPDGIDRSMEEFWKMEIENFAHYPYIGK